jgi:hypothetical protein
VIGMMNQLLFLATEGVEGIPGEHIASKLAVPIGIVFFCGSVFLLLWSNYGAKKGALIYSTALFGFTMMLGVFWWFGAPGTPVATGLQNFPGQAGDHYQAKWWVFEPGSERASYFDSANNLGDFQTIEGFLGLGDATEEQLEGNPKFAHIEGDVNQAATLMHDLFLHVEDGEPRLGGERRAGYQEAAEELLAAEVGAGNVEDWTRSSPFITAEPGPLLLNRDNGVLVTGTEFTPIANFQNADGTERLALPLEEFAEPRFAFKEPSALWFPSAVWTIISLVLFVLSLFGLDRIEQREKRALAEIQEPESLAVPIRQ